MEGITHTLFSVNRIRGLLNMYTLGQNLGQPGLSPHQAGDVAVKMGKHLLLGIVGTTIFINWWIKSK